MSLTTNSAASVKFSPSLHLIFINYCKPPDYHVTYILLHKLHVSGKNNNEIFLYELNGQLLRAIKSFYCRPKVCVRVNGKQSKPFHVGFGLRLGCVLSPLLFIVYMNWINKCSQVDKCATIANDKISRLLIADDLVLLSSTESGSSAH